jgi:hypothetical protein
MPGTKRIAQYIQRLTYQSLFQPEEREERPDDVLAPAPEVTLSYATWNPTSFATYVPFRSPTNG